MSRLQVSRTIALLVPLFLFANPSLKGQLATSALTTDIQQIFERSKGAVVKIQAVDEHGPLSGTGFFIDPNGTLYTSYTIGGESRDIVVLQGDKKFNATRVIADPRSGIAILKVETTRTPYIPLGKSSDLAIASMILTIAYPMDLPVTASFGLVGGFDVKYLDRYFATAHIRANIPVQRGEGGAPMLNMNGEAVGVLISCIDNNAGCFALPIEAAEKVRRDYMRFGEVRPGWLGILIQPAEEQVEGSIAQVQEVLVDTPAAKPDALRKGDILLEVGGKKIAAPEDVLNAAFFLSAGDEVPIKFVREGKILSIALQASDNPMRPHPTASMDPGMRLNNH
jgi:serine protease Do